MNAPLPYDPGLSTVQALAQTIRALAVAQAHIPKVTEPGGDIAPSELQRMAALRLGLAVAIELTRDGPLREHLTAIHDAEVKAAQMNAEPNDIEDCGLEVLATCNNYVAREIYGAAKYLRGCQRHAS